MLAAVDGVLAHPVAQGGVVDAKVAGDLGDRPAGGADQLDRVVLELGGELAPVPWLLPVLVLLLLLHPDILLSSEISCPWGRSNLASGRFLYQVCRKAVSASFTAFCEQLLAAYPTAPVVAVICDNVVIHHSKIGRRWLAAHPRLRVLHGARYSPHDNPTERIWGALKAYLANSPTSTMAGRIRQVHAFFRQRTNEQLLVTAAPHSSPWLPNDYGLLVMKRGVVPC